MIKNIILDVGMVLVDFCWEDLLHRLGIDGDDFEAVADATVRTPQWNEYDRSALTDQELLRIFCEKAPAHRAQIKLFWDNMQGMIVQYAYAKDWIRAMKAAGLRVYILSNYARRTYELTKDGGLDFLPLTDGAVFSFETGHIKPEPEIYQIIMDKFSLKAEECVFIDDNPANLVCPRGLGWSTVPFSEFWQVQRELGKLGVELDISHEIGRAK